MIPKETIDRIFETAKIEEVVSDYVPSLHRRGANLIGLCPFHNEKTGSFTVSPSKGIFKCFGCGKSGHAVGFIMEIEQCSYTEALKMLGKKYHIEIEERKLTEEEQQREDDRESMFVLNDFANQWFQDQLWNTPEGQAIGLGYFHERGLRDDVIRKFQLGYSPEKGSPLAKALLQKGFVEKYILNNVNTKIGTGICGKGEDGHIYDRFRDRVMFPIHTVSGKTVAFAGRIMKQKDNVGKYVNSPDSVIYSKTNELYGLFIAKKTISSENLCYMVEGQMDVISMYQSGIKNVVASGGTALTVPQILLIKRFTSNIVVLYDGDSAGIHAALRGIDMFLEQGFNVKVVLLPDGEDPDSFARTHNASDLLDYIERNKTDFIRFKSKLLSDAAGNDLQKKADLIKDVALSISKIQDAITRQVYIKATAEQLHITEYVLNREVAFLRRKKKEEIIKAKYPRGNRGEMVDSPESDNIDTIPSADIPIAENNISSPKQNRLEENYRNLMQMVVRYGEHPLYSDGTNSISVGDYVFSQLANDGIAAPNEVYKKMMGEFLEHSHDEGFVANKFFKFHPDAEVSKMAIDMIADKYQLSQIYSKKNVSENVVQEIDLQTEEDQLPELIQRLLLEIKLTVIEQRIDETETQLKNAQKNGDWTTQRMLLATQPQLLSIKNEICRQLGNRVIT